MMARLVKHCPVLIVEDDEDLREMMAQLLTLEGFQTATVANGREALEYLHEASAPDVILLDLMMPVMDGWEFRRQQQADRKSTRLNSSHSSISYAVFCLKKKTKNKKNK